MKQIPVTIDGNDTGVWPSAALKAIFSEIEAMLNTLVVTGEHDYIDLRGLPLAPSDLGLLKRILGSGEVDATVDALGPTYIHETAIPGVWWITNKNTEEVTISEYLEITTLPEMLATQHQDLHNSVSIMRERLKTLGVTTEKHTA